MGFIFCLSENFKVFPKMLIVNTTDRSLPPVKSYSIYALVNHAIEDRCFNQIAC